MVVRGGEMFIVPPQRRGVGAPRRKKEPSPRAQRPREEGITSGLSQQFGDHLSAAAPLGVGGRGAAGRCAPPPPAVLRVVARAAVNLRRQGDSARDEQRVVAALPVNDDASGGGEVALRDAVDLDVDALRGGFV